MHVADSMLVYLQMRRIDACDMMIRKYFVLEQTTYLYACGSFMLLRASVLLVVGRLLRAARK